MPTRRSTSADTSASPSDILMDRAIPQALDNHEGSNFLLLLAHTKQLTFKGLYACEDRHEAVLAHKIVGFGPPKLDTSMVSANTTSVGSIASSHALVLKKTSHPGTPTQRNPGGSRSGCFAPSLYTCEIGLRNHTHAEIPRSRIWGSIFGRFTAHPGDDGLENGDPRGEHDPARPRTWLPQSRNILRPWTFPPPLQVSSFYKYNSAAREFQEVHTKTVGKNTDAISVEPTHLRVPRNRAAPRP